MRKRKLAVAVPLILICSVSLFFSSDAESFPLTQKGFRPAPQTWQLQKISSQKSEYDFLYGMGKTGCGEGVPPLPNAFTHPKPQPLG